MTLKPIYAALVVALLASAGCSSTTSTYDANGHRQTMTINGKKHYFDEKGNLIMTRAEYQKYIELGIGKPPIATDPKRKMKVTAEELAVLMKDRSAFYAKLDGVNDEPDEVSVLMSEGTLKGNLLHIAEELGYTSVEWLVTDNFYVAAPYAVTGLHRRAVIVNIISDYPIKVFADEENDRLVFTPQSVGYGQ